MNVHIEKLKAATAPYRNQLIQHPLYAKIKTQEHLAVFMEHHVFAVWDFMSLLKALQRNLTCVDLPWVPVGNPQTRYLINEIVLGEESDVDEHGKRVSHFELYFEAMQQVGCNLEPVSAFLDNIIQKKTLQESVLAANVPQASADFMSTTFSVTEANKLHVQAAVFTFGREDLIPGMFLSFVKELNTQTSNSISILKYYLERHIEVDGEHHSHLAYEMTEELCGDDAGKWEEATAGTITALKARIRLWDAIAGRLN